jgi:hypothetical protein
MKSFYPATTLAARIDRSGVATTLKLKGKKPFARLFTMRVGYDVAVVFGGAMEQVTQ